MGWVIATRKAEPGRGGRARRRLSGIAGLIALANLAGVLILVVGSLVFNELRTGLTQARTDALRVQGSTIASVLAEAAVVAEAAPALDEGRARLVLKRLFREPNARLRLFAPDGRLIADSDVLYDRIDIQALPPVGPAAPDVGRAAGAAVSRARVAIQGALEDPALALSEEVAEAAQGRIVARERLDETGRRVVSVSVPVQRVRAIVAVLTLESGDVADVVAAERRALYPFIAASILVAALSAAWLAWSVARPLRRLAAAADAVRSGEANAVDAPDLAQRRDEIGDLAGALGAMTSALNQRIAANERFAADVAHEIKNPLAAIRNAAEILPRAPEGSARDRLLSIILDDARRVDRLVTDISNASRMDAEWSRAQLEPLSLSDLVDDLGRAYAALAHGGTVRIAVSHDDPADRLMVRGQSEALTRALANLLDNALSFSPDGGMVRLSCGRAGSLVVARVDDEGPGIPQEALEKVFERFYTHRPTGEGAEGRADFGRHSGLGLAIGRQIAEGHRGRLSAENRAGPPDGPGGARFILSLPAA